MAEILPEARLNDLRKKILANEEVTPEEVGAILATLRAKRGNIGETKVAAAKKAAAAKLPVDLNALFAGKKEGET